MRLRMARFLPWIGGSLLSQSKACRRWIKTSTKLLPEDLIFLWGRIWMPTRSGGTGSNSAKVWTLLLALESSRWTPSARGLNGGWCPVCSSIQGVPRISSMKRRPESVRRGDPFEPAMMPLVAAW